MNYPTESATLGPLGLRSFLGSQQQPATHSNSMRSKYKNPPKPMFSNFLLNETGTSISAPFVAARCTAMQPRCIFLPNFAICEIANCLLSPMAGLACSFVCNTSRIAKNNDARPVGGRGISAFSSHFFFGCNLLSHADFSVCIVCISL